MLESYVLLYILSNSIQSSTKDTLLKKNIQNNKEHGKRQKLQENVFMYDDETNTNYRVVRNYASIKL